MKQGVPQALGRGWVAGLLMACAAIVCAADGSEERLERERIAAERAALNARFAENERDCAGRFATTACVDDARRELREGLTRLRRQESSLDAAQRKLRAAQRVQTIRDRVAAEEARQREASGGATRGGPRAARLRIAAPRDLEAQDAPSAGPGSGVEPADEAASAARPAVPTARARPPGAVPRSASSAAVRGNTTTRRTAYEERQRAAQAHREAVKRRNAERAASGKAAAAPLPPGPGASEP